ncbi:DUF2309 domain-containing protein [Rickettsiales endosymbiont of Peranema trichophorum]|uniref:DUF2309 domain-containing protein n=1 Tax=Rickettsiales endosymbiont of Peranema trichophorum TaxID=2486577 RepID=UPI001023768F|nr:DUF2309 domain-containing protein [Rickettsiales endosymbiont of Peranema trichophorum]RZI46365.1 DUF2309 domain-containing protein [Rickettsiales endosymbiont of Peranema trichophorum]
MKNIQEAVKQSFKIVQPLWPLQKLIAINPLHGMEDLPIEEALQNAAVYFEQKALPKGIEDVNRETIKWLQAYCDAGQATIQMPFRAKGLYEAWRRLCIYDKSLCKNEMDKQWLEQLPINSEDAIKECISKLGIASEDCEGFLRIMVATLPGWASYVKYLTEWSCHNPDNTRSPSISQLDYIAVRLSIACVLYPEAGAMLGWYEDAKKSSDDSIIRLLAMEKLEVNYRTALFRELSKEAVEDLDLERVDEIQLVFCMDVRAEPFRKALEGRGNYNTFSVAGFFGVPVQIANKVTGTQYNSCPVLLLPSHVVDELPCNDKDYNEDRQSYKMVVTFKRLYQSLKYTSTTPFALAEGLGMMAGLLMVLRSLTPLLASRLQAFLMRFIRRPINTKLVMDRLSLEDRVLCAETLLKMMGLTKNFATIVVFCGHGSTTQNNPYATGLDCGACGAKHGGPNARIIVDILNDIEVRTQLFKSGIKIPKETIFVAAEHDTTTDAVTFYDVEKCEALHPLKLEKLRRDLKHAREVNNLRRLRSIAGDITPDKATYCALRRSQDWSEARPEWGLAGNKALIVGPRHITRNIDLKGECFLHSYYYRCDSKEGALLGTILGASMVVAHWINSQYLFATLDNVAYGSGSKITKNITGKMGVIQGNASDLMTGLPLQSLYIDDVKPYHKPQRLTTIVYAPRELIDLVIRGQQIPQRLFCNGWVHLACIEPGTGLIYMLKRDLTWGPSDI